MSEFLKELEQLPEERQKAIKKGLQNQIVAQAEFIRDEQPTKFLAYIDEEIEKANTSMLKMVQESSREGAELGTISEIYIWNKERKKVLARLRDEVQAEPKQAAPEPQRGELLYYCQIAVKQGLLVKTETGYKRVEGKMSKAQLAYLLGRFLKDDGTLPESKYDAMFGESRLGKELYQISGNKNGGGKPRGYEIIDELLQM
jgi:hypothetical protein